MKYFAALLLVLSLGFNSSSFGSSCLKPGQTAGPYDEWGFPSDTLTAGNAEIRTADDELDLIYSLLTYAIVFKTWQADSDAAHPIRGYNYGAVLINSANEIAHWGRNEVFAEKDETQHAETRAIQQYLKTSGTTTLKGYAIYVGGDSCPMCAGMISQQQIVRAVLGLSHPQFGKNFDRMNLDSRDCGDGAVAGVAPVTRKVLPVMSPSEIRKDLDRAFRFEVIKGCGGTSLKDCKAFPSQTDFLKSQVAHDLFAKANQGFSSYQVKFPNQKASHSGKTNAQLYQAAVQFLKDRVN